MSPVSSASPGAEQAHATPQGSRRSLLLVHHLGSRQLASVEAALGAGSDVACISADPALTAELGPGLRVLPARALPGFEDGAFVQGSFDLVEAGVAELTRRRTGLVRALERVVGSPDVDRYLCRALLREAGDFLAVLLFIASPYAEGYDSVTLERTWPHGLDHAFLAGVVRHGRVGLPAHLLEALERTSFAAESGSGLRRRAATVVGVAREAASLWREWLPRVGPAARRLPKRALLVRSYDEDWGVNIEGQQRLRNLDFFVDGEMIRPDEVGVWAEDGVPRERDAELVRRGYEVYRRDAIRVGPWRLLTHLIPSLIGTSAILARACRAERWWGGPVRRLLGEFLLWSELTHQVRPRVLLALNDIQPSGIARTLALRRAGCLSVEYEFSSHWLTDENGWVPDYVYGFTVVDTMVSWGPLHTRHLANHRGRIREFWEVGCLWSEHARLVREQPPIGDFYRDAVAEAHGVALGDYEAVVGVFDTSTASFFGHDDMVAFYAGAAALAARFPRVLFLCKPKRPLEVVFAEGAGGAEVGAALAVAENVVLFPERFETAAAVGLCDLSINACFTSPAVETIGAGRPALYYDPTDLFPRSFFRRIPSFVATDPEELASLVEELLAVDAAKRSDDLRARFSELEGHFDGLAITRLRESLRRVLDA